MPRGKPFEKNNKLATGGARPGAGRPSDWFREQAQKALEEAKGLEFMRDVASGVEFPQLATSEGEVINLPPPLKERRAAVEWLADRAHGRALESVKLDATVHQPEPIVFVPTSKVAKKKNASDSGQ